MDDTPYINDGADASLRKAVSLLNKIEAKTGATTITGPVTVSNEVEVTNSTGNPIPVSGPLTDAELRATALPISGTVTANVGIASESEVTQFGEWIANGFNAAQPTIAVIGTSGGQPFPISGTVTANLGNTEQEWNNIGAYFAQGFTGYSNVPVALVGGDNFVRLNDSDGNSIVFNNGNLPISGTVTANVDALSGNTTFTDSTEVKTLRVLPHYFDVNSNENITVDNDTHPLPISGTVTANVDFSGPVGTDQTPVPSKAIAVGWVSDGNTLFQSVNENAPLPVQVVAGALTPAEVPVSGTVTANLSESVAETQNRFITSAGDSLGDAGVHIAVEKSDNTVGLVGTGTNSVPLPVSGTFWQATQPVSVASALSTRVAGWDIPVHDYRSLGYTSGNLTSITYKTGGAGGTTVATLTLAYDGGGNLTSMTKT